MNFSGVPSSNIRVVVASGNCQCCNHAPSPLQNSFPLSTFHPPSYSNRRPPSVTQVQPQFSSESLLTDDFFQNTYFAPLPQARLSGPSTSRFPPATHSQYMLPAAANSSFFSRSLPSAAAYSQLYAPPAAASSASPFSPPSLPSAAYSQLYAPPAAASSASPFSPPPLPSAATSSSFSSRQLPFANSYAQTAPTNLSSFPTQQLNTQFASASSSSSSQLYASQPQALPAPTSSSSSSSEHPRASSHPQPHASRASISPASSPSEQQHASHSQSRAQLEQPQSLPVAASSSDPTYGKVKKEKLHKTNDETHLPRYRASSISRFYENHFAKFYSNGTRLRYEGSRSHEVSLFSSESDGTVPIQNGKVQVKFMNGKKKDKIISCSLSDLKPLIVMGNYVLIQRPPLRNQYFLVKVQDLKGNYNSICIESGKLHEDPPEDPIVVQFKTITHSLCNTIVITDNAQLSNLKKTRAKFRGTEITCYEL